MAQKTAKKAAKKAAAKRAITAEVADEGIEFEYDGAVYTTLPPLDMPLEVLEASETGAGLTAIRLMLVEGDWERFRATGPRVRDLEGFASALAEATGMESAGN